MDLLRNPIRPYAWGSPTAIPELLGVAADGTPQAELWMGAHPGDPSAICRDGAWRSLRDVVAADPDGELGAAVTIADGRLPFLFKVLAAAQPLSLQAHPNPAQARAGFARENAAGIPLDSPRRRYLDDSAKPELVCALTPFRALCGFADPAEPLAAARAFGVAELDEVFAPLRADPGQPGVRQTFTALLELPPAARERLVGAVAAAAADLLGATVRGSGAAAVGEPLAAGGFPSGVDGVRGRARVVVDLAARYPGDAGVVATLLLNHVVLAPGEALYLPAGNLHAYLGGVGVEIMASSDNVLRGGLTVKPVDVAELLRVLDFTPGPVRVLRPVPQPGGEGVYPTPAAAFSLGVVDVEPERPVELSSIGPQILLCVDGAVAVSAAGAVERLRRGTAVFVPARDGAVRLTGAGRIYRAGPGRRADGQVARTAC